VATRWVDFAGQAIFHTLVAALVVEALVRLWRVRQPEQRTGFRLLALVWPLLGLPVLFFAFPGREAESFRDARALFAGRHWDDLAFLGVGLYGWWVAGMALVGLLLFLLDLVPWLRARGSVLPVSTPQTPEGGRAAEALALASGDLGLQAPPLVFVAGGPPLLYCTGTRRPVVVVSRAAVELLDGAELRGALAHELSHLERRDPALSWALMAARAMMWFNPGVQVLVRAIARDSERLADERASAATGDRLALASGLLKLFRATDGRRARPPPGSLPVTMSLAEPIARARAHDIALRCRALLDPPPVPVALGRTRLAAVGAGLFLLLFFVV
jgi:Zn-dependent protease with chaperone function